MNPPAHRRLLDYLFVSFALFVFGATFSIALAQIALFASLLLFLAYCLTTRCKPLEGNLKLIYGLIAAGLVWTAVSALAGATPIASIMALREEWLYCTLPVGIFLLRRSRYRDRLLTAFAAGVALIAVYSLIQYLTGLDLAHDKPLVPAGDFGYRVRGSFTSRMTFGNFYATSSLVLLGLGVCSPRTGSHRLRTLWFAAGGLAGLVTVLTYTRGAILALAVGLLLLLCCLRRRHALTALAALLVAAVVTFAAVPGLWSRFSRDATRDLNPSYEGSRLFIWHNTARIVAEHPVFGVGPGNFAPEYAKLLRPDIDKSRRLTHAHNDLLNQTAQSGLPGGALWAALWIAVVLTIWRGRKKHPPGSPAHGLATAALLGSAAFAVTSIFEATFADEEVRQLLMFVWALGLAATYKDQTEPASDNAAESA